MKRTLAPALLSVLLLLFQPGTVRADDPKAEELFAKAKAHFQKNEYIEAEQLARKACETASTRPTQMSCLLLLGRVHQVKTGDFKLARWCFNKVILLGVNLEKDQYRERLLKAQAMLGLGNLIYAEKGNLLQTIGRFQAGHKTYPTPDTAEIVAQLMYRLAQMKDRTPGARKKQLEQCIKLCDEVKARLRREPRNDLRARADILRVLALRAMGQEIEAELAWRKVDQRHFEVNSLYHQALLLASRGKTADEVGKKVREFMEKTRPTVRARNQFRKFVKTEPDFQGFLKAKSWKWIVKEEPPPLEEEEFSVPTLKTPRGADGKPLAKPEDPKPEKTTAVVAKKTEAAAPKPGIKMPDAVPPPAPPKAEKSDSSLKFVVFILAFLLLAAVAFLRLNKA